MSINQRRRPPSPQPRRNHSAFRFGENNNNNSNFNFVPDNVTGAPSFPSTSGRRDGRAPRRNQGRGGRGGFKQRGFKRLGASDRGILRARRSPTPEQMAGMNTADSRFRVLDELPSESDPGDEDDDDEDDDGKTGSGIADDGVEADRQSTDGSSENEHPRAKRARNAGTRTQISDSKPVWSNPDPYTSLPPEVDHQAPKKDVVAMIRKAKVENADRNAERLDAAEFISLNFDDDDDHDDDDDDDDKEDGEVEDWGRVRLPRRNESSLAWSLAAGDRSRSPPSPARSHHTGTDRWPPSASYRNDDGYHDPRGRRRSRSPQRLHSQHDSPARGYRDRYEPASDSSNRTSPPTDRREYASSHDEDPASGAQREAPAGHAGAALGKRKRNAVATGYTMLSSISDVPWMDHSSPASHSPGEWLHDEVRSFTEYVSPRDFERQARMDLIRRVEEAFRLKYATVEVTAFGSFATDMYLPVSDMDLVATTLVYRNTGLGQLGQRPNQLHKIAQNVIKSGGLAHSTQVIARAKVPLIKFSERSTGVKVDISFENHSGIHAISTVRQWQDQYPALRYLVYPIKRLLDLHGLNDVASGGIGGFSVICLVAMRLYHLHAAHSTAWIMDNLDFALMDFLDFYGNQFDYRHYGLDMGTMRSVLKSSWAGDRLSQPGRLLTVDPNNPRNDISGGTGRIADIFRLFKRTFESLKREMDLATSRYRDTGVRHSLLRSVLGDDFSMYEYQRDRLYQLYNKKGAEDESIEFVGYKPVPKGRSRADAIDLTAAESSTPDSLSLRDESTRGPPVVRAPSIRVKGPQSNASNAVSVDASAPPNSSTPHVPSDGQAVAAGAAHMNGSLGANGRWKHKAEQGKAKAATQSNVAAGKKKRKKSEEKKKKLEEKKKEKKNKKEAMTVQPVTESTSAAPAISKGLPGAKQAREEWKQQRKEKQAKQEKEKKKAAADIDRAKAFRAQFPDVACPEQLNKKTFRAWRKDTNRAKMFKARFPDIACPERLHKRAYRKLSREHGLHDDFTTLRSELH